VNLMLTGLIQLVVKLLLHVASSFTTCIIMVVLKATTWVLVAVSTYSDNHS